MSKLPASEKFLDGESRGKKGKESVLSVDENLKLQP